MATSSKRSRAGKDADKKSSKKVEEEVVRLEEPPVDIREPTPAPVIEEQVVEEVAVPTEPEPEPVYEEPILTKLIVESYEGDKVKGLYDGYGVAWFVGGHQYEGQFSEGLMHGHGRYIWADGVVYEGEFTKNQVTGKGKYIWTDGSTYEGDVLNGMRHGVGVFFCPQRNLTYSGEWVLGKQTGKGRLDYDLHGFSFYDGQWLNNVRHGYGVRRYPSGNIYEGTWYKNQRHGRGTMQWFDKHQSFSGTWQNGFQHGIGQQVWYLRRGASTQYSLRNMYDGELNFGKRHGFGTFYYANGARYEGEWKNNVKCGKGKFIFKNGRIYEGLFQDDRIDEFPLFEMDALATPDLSRIRTRTPLPCESRGSVRGNESVNTFSPSFRLDIEHLLQEMVDADREEEAAQVAFVVSRHMTSLHHVYLFYSRLGHDDNPDNTFVMTQMQFWRFLKDCHLLDSDYGLVDVDRWLARTPDRYEEMHNPYKQLLFREFLDYLVVIAYHLNHDQHTSGPVLAGCMSRLITEKIFKFACIVRGNVYCKARRTANALVHMNDLFGIYRAMCSPSKRQPSDSVLTMRQFMLALKDMNLINEDLTSKAFVNILASDDPKVIDSQGGINMELEIVFLEFFEALIGCAQVFVTVSSLATLGGSIQQSELERNLPHKEESALNLTSVPDFSNEIVSTTSITVDEGALAADATSSSNAVVDDMQTSDYNKRELPRPTESLSTDEPMRSLIVRSSANEVDEEMLAFNLWTHQVHTFFVQKFFPAARTHVEVKMRLGAERSRKLAGICMEPYPQRNAITA